MVVKNSVIKPRRPANRTRFVSTSLLLLGFTRKMFPSWLLAVAAVAGAGNRTQEGPGHVVVSRLPASQNVGSAARGLW